MFQNLIIASRRRIRRLCCVSRDDRLIRPRPKAINWAKKKHLQKSIKLPTGTHRLTQLKCDLLFQFMTLPGANFNCLWLSKIRFNYREKQPRVFLCVSDTWPVFVQSCHLQGIELWLPDTRTKTMSRPKIDPNYRPNHSHYKCDDWMNHFGSRVKKFDQEVGAILEFPTWIPHKKRWWSLSNQTGSLKIPRSPSLIRSLMVSECLVQRQSYSLNILLSFIISNLIIGFPKPAHSLKLSHWLLEWIWGIQTK